jgi:hypothetical protein
MQRLKVGLEASFAGSRLTRGRAAGWPAVILFVNSRSGRYEYHTHEKSVRFARRALSASLSWGKHRLSQEAGLFGDVLLHRSIVTEIPVFFQWYLLITVITHRL